jgi:hypothetical protein
MSSIQDFIIRIFFGEQPYIPPPKYVKLKIQRHLTKGNKYYH